MLQPKSELVVLTSSLQARADGQSYLSEIKLRAVQNNAKIHHQWLARISFPARNAMKRIVHTTKKGANSPVQKKRASMAVDDKSGEKEVRRAKQKGDVRIPSPQRIHEREECRGS